MKSHQGLNKNWQLGFTLLEVLLATSLLVTAGIIGLVGYNQFSTSQNFENAVLNVYTFFAKAKSRAQSQLKPGNISACQTGVLDGYAVVIYPGNNRYELDVQCSGTKVAIESNQLPNSITFGVTTQTMFLFHVLNGSVDSGTVTINGAGKTKIIQVTSNGGISIQ